MFFGPQRLQLSQQIHLISRLLFLCFYLLSRHQLLLFLLITSISLTGCNGKLSEDKILAKTVARQIQPKLEEMQHANPFKKAFLILKYLVLGNRSAKCTIPREALASYVRTILPDIYAFFETEEGLKAYEEWKAEKPKAN